MKIDERFEVTRDTYCWRLNDYREIISKKGQPKRTSRTTYHANFGQVSEAILDRAAGTCSELSDIPKIIKEQTDRIVAAIDKAKRDVVNLSSTNVIVKAI